MRRVVGPLLLLAVCLSPGAVTAGEKANGGTLGFVAENDVFHRFDGHYTNGLRLTWLPAREAPTPAWAAALARLVPWFPDDRGMRHGYALGQSMFTPLDITVADPPLSDRPYAGWLYGSIGLGIETGSQLDQFGLTVGIIGPASLAEQGQKFIHDVFDSEEPRGWDAQLGNEPGFVLTYLRSWRGLGMSPLDGAQIDVTPHAGGALGNVFIYGNAGVTLRYGRQLPDDYGPPRIQPGLPGSADFSPAAAVGWHLFAGIEGRVVARNLFLDGNTFRDSRSVDREVLVGDLQFGVVLDWRSLRLSYTHVFRSREFRENGVRDGFGSISVLVKL